MAKATFRQIYNHVLAAFPDAKELPCVLYDGDIEDEQTLETAIDIIDAFYGNMSLGVILAAMLGEMNIGRPEEIKLFWTAYVTGKAAANGKIQELEKELTGSRAEVESLTMELELVSSAKFRGRQKDK